jgi:hypothetical protein
MASQERRAFPRIADEGVSVKLKAGDFDTITHTMNISASGVYCKVNDDIPLMSRVKLMVMIPELTKDGPVIRNIEVTGVVVRQHPVIIDGQTKHYDLAIFFEDLTSKNREIITNYISRKK